MIAKARYQNNFFAAVQTRSIPRSGYMILIGPMPLCYFPNRSYVAAADTKTAVFAPACAMKDINIRGLLVRVRLECLDFVIFRVAAAMRNLLIMF